MPRRLGSHGAVLVLGAIVLASTVARVALSAASTHRGSHRTSTSTASSDAGWSHGDGLTIVGEPIPYYSLLYPLFVGLAGLGTDVTTGLTVAQVAQALAMSATAIPVFLWARPPAGSRLALFAGTLTVLIPGLAYSALLMSEALYYPVAVVALWVLAAALRDPTLWRQLLLVVTIGMAVATRLQAVGLVATLVVALGTLAVAERSLAPFRRLLPSLVALGAAGAVLIAGRLAAEGGETLGAYGTLAEAGEYSVADVVSSIAWQTGAVVILTVGVPLVALGVLTWEVLRGREGDVGVRALVAAASRTSSSRSPRSAYSPRGSSSNHGAPAALGRAAGFVAFAVWLGRECHARSPSPRSSRSQWPPRRSFSPSSGSPLVLRQPMPCRRYRSSTCAAKSRR